MQRQLRSPPRRQDSASQQRHSLSGRVAGGRAALAGKLNVKGLKQFFRQLTLKKASLLVISAIFVIFLIHHLHRFGKVLRARTREKTLPSIPGQPAEPTGPRVKLPVVNRITEPKVRTLIIYSATADINGDGIASDNLRHFLLHGLLEYPQYKFLLVLNGCHRYSLTDWMTDHPISTLEIYERKGDCAHAGAWLDGLQLMDERGKKFKRYILLNSLVRGPFKLGWFDEDWDWVERFSYPLNSPKIKLVGTSTNCADGNLKNFHLSQFTLATDDEGMKCCVRPALEEPKLCVSEAPLPGGVYRLEDESKDWRRGVDISQRILNAGFHLASHMLVWSGVELSLANLAGIRKVCVDELNHGINGDIYYDGMYGSNAISLNPLELMFFQTSRIRPTVVESYTKWLDNRRKDLDGWWMEPFVTLT